MLNTARSLADIRIDGVKIHVFHVLKGSAFQKPFSEGKVKLLEEDEYVGLVCDFLELLPAATIVHRLTGQGSRESHIAPAWALNKSDVIMKIEEIFKKRGSRQGALTEGELRPIL